MYGGIGQDKTSNSANQNKMSRPSQSSRKSLVYTSRSTLVASQQADEDSIEYTERQTLEVEKLEQEITLVLQDIDRNLGKANKIINDSLIPVILDYKQNSKKLWNDVGFWKKFFENSGDVQFSTAEPINGEEQEVQGYEDESMGVDDQDPTDMEESIVNRYHEEFRPNSSMIKSTPKRGGDQRQRLPSSPPDSTITSITNNGKEINFHEAYKVKLTPNKRAKAAAAAPRSIFDDSPEIPAPQLASLSPLRAAVNQDTNNGSPPKRTPSRILAQAKTDDLKDMIGVNDSSTMSQVIAPNFQLPVSVVQNNDSSTLSPPNFVVPQSQVQSNSDKENNFELDSLLDNKYKELTKGNDSDWSDA